MHGCIRHCTPCRHIYMYVYSNVVLCKIFFHSVFTEINPFKMLFVLVVYTRNRHLLCMCKLKYANPLPLTFKFVHSISSCFGTIFTYLFSPDADVFSACISSGLYYCITHKLNLQNSNKKICTLKSFHYHSC